MKLSWWMIPVAVIVGFGAGAISEDMAQDRTDRQRREASVSSVTLPPRKDAPSFPDVDVGDDLCFVWYDSFEGPYRATVAGKLLNTGAVEWLRVKDIRHWGGKYHGELVRDSAEDIVSLDGFTYFDPCEPIELLGE